MSFDPFRIVEVLARLEVRYVLIGGLAAVTQGSPVVTNDLDICYDRRPDNLERLAAALTELQARLRGAPEGLPFLLDAETLRRGDCFTFSTTAGPLDVLGTPSGSTGYDDLAMRAVTVDLNGPPVMVAAVADLIAMKRAAGHVKDHAHVLHLEALREELERPDPAVRSSGRRDING